MRRRERSLVLWWVLVATACGSSPDVTTRSAVTSAVTSSALPTTIAPRLPSTTAEATTSTAPSTTATPPHRTVTLAFSGDVLVHSPIWRQAERSAQQAGGTGYDFAPFFADTRHLIESVDLAVCHLEVPLRRPGREPSTHPIYGAPAEVVAGIAAGGYDHCSTASNHALDQGTEGIDLTVAEFERIGLTQSGMARTPDEIEPRVLQVDGDTGPVAVSLLSYTWSFNGLSTPHDQPWRSALIDPERIIDDAAVARDRGAELVIVSLHWGAEKVHDVTTQQRRWAEQITASGLVDLIVGHHAHVVQPIEQVNGVWVVYGLGNVLSNHPSTDQWPAASQDAMIVTVAATVLDGGERQVARPVVHPTWVDRRQAWVIRDVLGDLADPTLPPERRGPLEASLQRTARIVGDHLARNR